MERRLPYGEGRTDVGWMGQSEKERGALLLPSVFFPGSLPLSPFLRINGRLPTSSSSLARSLSHSTHLSLSLSASASVAVAVRLSFTNSHSHLFFVVVFVGSTTFLLFYPLLFLVRSLPSLSSAVVPRMQQGRVILLARYRRPAAAGGGGGGGRRGEVAVGGTIKFSCTALRLLARSLSLSTALSPWLAFRWLAAGGFAG